MQNSKSLNYDTNKTEENDIINNNDKNYDNFKSNQLSEITANKEINLVTSSNSRLHFKFKNRKILIEKSQALIFFTNNSKLMEIEKVFIQLLLINRTLTIVISFQSATLRWISKLL